MSAITDSELTAIEERAAKATEGPWETCETEADIGARGGFWFVNASDVHASTVAEVGYGKAHGQDATFIAHARTDVPRLCRAVRETREEDMRLRAILSLFGLNVDAPTGDIARAAAIIVEDQADANEQRIDALMKCDNLKAERDAALAAVDERAEVERLRADRCVRCGFDPTTEPGSQIYSCVECRTDVCTACSEDGPLGGVRCESCHRLVAERDAALAEVQLAGSQLNDARLEAVELRGELERLRAEFAALRASSLDLLACNGQLAAEVERLKALLKKIADKSPPEWPEWKGVTADYSDGYGDATREAAAVAHAALAGKAGE